MQRAMVDDLYRKEIEKGEAPDVLLLSATPIPRTLALTLYGDLDISIIRRKPVNRRPIRTGVRSGADRTAVYRFVQQQAEEGRQAYVVYPVIDESERVDLKAATTMAEQLSKTLAPLGEVPRVRTRGPSVPVGHGWASASASVQPDAE